MELKIISWNIRHFREKKIIDFIHTLWEVIVWCDVCFIYEDHAGKGTALAKALNEYESRLPLDKVRNHWMGKEIHTTDEYVAIVWKGGVQVTPHSAATAVFSELMSGERCPAAVKIEKSGKSSIVAAWHAYGPAKVSAKDLFQRILQVNICDVLIGDFNFQTFATGLGSGGLNVTDDDFSLVESLDYKVPPMRTNSTTSLGLSEAPSSSSAVPVVASSSSSSSLDPAFGGKSSPMRSSRLEDKVHMKEIVPANHQGSTTYTEDRVGKRTTGLDRCLVRKQFVSSCKLMVAMPEWFDELFCLTDHMVLQLIIDI